MVEGQPSHRVELVVKVSRGVVMVVLEMTVWHPMELLEMLQPQKDRIFVADRVEEVEVAYRQPTFLVLVETVELGVDLLHGSTK